MQYQNAETTGTNNPDETLPPFVNEECGDSMWDEVLKEMEANTSKVNELLQFNF